MKDMKASGQASRLEAWIGRTETSRDVVTPTPVIAMTATLDNGNPMPATGEDLPPLWHWLYFLPHPKRSEIGPDGHAARGGFLPPVELPRRMWAGSRIEWHAPIRVGDALTRTSRIESITRKSGKTGDLVFVLAIHVVANADGPVLTEEHDIVYRDAPEPGSTPPAPPRARTDEAWSRRIVPDDVLLFRYSALTFNGHRIHYDRRYVTEVEGYPGLIVHGPLIATLLVELLRSERPGARLVRFSFRAISPLFDLFPFEVCGRPGSNGNMVDLWARNADGGLAMLATAELAPRPRTRNRMKNELPHPDAHQEMREALRGLTATFDSAYWQKVDHERGYPAAFVDALTEAGWLAALIPTEYGGSGLGLAEASVIMEEINRSGGNAGSCHGQMYNMGTLLRHGSEEQKQRYLPRIATGELRLQTMAVTEPTTGTDTTQLKTVAVKKGDRYVVTGQKVWISRIQHSDMMILLARTTPLAEVSKKSEGMSVFLVDLHQAIGNGMTVRPIANMVNHETNEVFFDELEIPAENLIGAEGRGFRYILDGLNAERTLIAAECIGDGWWFVERARNYANDRVVFGRPIGKNQGVQFPIAENYIELAAADLMRWKACELFDAGKPCGAEANMAKYLAAKASFEAANTCLQTHGGFGFAAEYDVERKFRETRLYQVAPISTNLILSHTAEHVLGMPRSF